MRWVLLVVVSVVGLVMWLSWQDDAAPPQLPATHDARQTEQVETPPTPVRGDARTLEAADAPKPDAEAHPDDSPQPVADDGKQPMLAATTLLLHVTRAADGQPVTAFRWRFDVGSDTQRGDGENGQCELALPGGSTGRLLVEADGMQPFARADLVLPEPPAAPLVLDVALSPAAVATGITLQVHDLSGQPIADAQVAAFRIDDQNRDLAWQLGKELWLRRAHSENGRYQLPELPPGEYGIELLAVDADGNLQPLLPYRQHFLLTGSNGFVEDVPLEPGALPKFELVEPNGALLDPAVHGKILLDLRLPGGPAIQRKWIVGIGGGATASALDALPGVGVVWPAEPVPPGRYRIEVRVNHEPRASQTIDLVPGVGTQRIVVQ